MNVDIIIELAQNAKNFAFTQKTRVYLPPNSTNVSTAGLLTIVIPALQQLNILTTHLSLLNEKQISQHYLHRHY
jgi:hypothetical protein